MSDLSARIKPKKSSTAGEVPQAADLEVAEIAVNTADGKLFVKHTDDSIKEISGTGGATAIDELSDVDTSTVAPTDGQVLTWDNANSQWEPATPTTPSTATSWSVTADGTSNYIFAGDGFAGTEADPVLYVVRGQTYEITNSMGAHPFQIQSTSGIGGTAYSDGITNNAVSSGTLTWEVRLDAPAELYYQCTAHADMGGTIQVLENSAGGGGAVDSVNGQTGVVVLDLEDLDNVLDDRVPETLGAVLGPWSNNVEGDFPEANGEWRIFSVNTPDVIQFYKLDDGGTDHSAALLAITSGSTFEWSTDNSNWTTVTVTQDTEFSIGNGGDTVLSLFMSDADGTPIENLPQGAGSNFYVRTSAVPASGGAADGQILAWSDANSQWEPVDAASGGSGATPVTATPQAVSDQANNSLLLDTSAYSGTSVTSVDADTTTWNLQRAATFTTSWALFPGGAMNFSGNDGYIRPANTSTLSETFAGDLVVACWIRKSGDSNGPIFDFRNGANESIQCWVEIGDTISARIGVTADGGITTSAAIPDGDHHIALVRSGQIVTLYIDGMSEGSYDAGIVRSITFNSSSYKNFGAYEIAAASYYYSGYIADVAINNGEAVWTSNFTPPASNVEYFQLSGELVLPTGSVGDLAYDTANGDYYNATSASSWGKIVHHPSTLEPTDGQVLTWVDANSQWEPTTSSGGGGAVDSVNGETGVVSLGIQDMDDFELDVPPGPPPEYRYSYRQTYSADMCSGGNAQANTYFQLAQVDAYGLDSKTYVENLSVNDSIWVQLPGQALEEITLLEAAWDLSNCRFYFKPLPVGTESLVDNDEVGVSFSDPGGAQPPTQLAEGDILQWNDAEQVFKPAALVDNDTKRIQEMDDYMPKMTTPTSPKGVWTFDTTYSQDLCSRQGTVLTSGIGILAHTDNLGTDLSSFFAGITSAGYTFWIQINDGAYEEVTTGATTVDDPDNCRWYWDVQPAGWGALTSGDTVRLFDTDPNAAATELPLAAGDVMAWNASESAFMPTQLRAALGIEEYADDASAGTGGLASGALYYNTTSSDYRLKA